MKYLIILIFLNMCSIHNNIALKFSGKWYEWYIKELKDFLRNGLPSMGIPKLDPFQVDSSFCWENPTNKINLDLKGSLANFSDFYVNNIDIKPDLQSTIELQFTSLSFLGNYQLSGEAMRIVPLDTSGNIEIFFGNVILIVECKIYGSNTTIQFSKFGLKYDFGVSKVSIAGLFKQYYLNDIILHFLSELVPSVLNQLKSQVQIMIDKITLDYGNKWLKKMDPKHVIEKIKSIIVVNNFLNLFL